MTTIGGIDPSFTGKHTGSEPPYAKLPHPATLFAKRAARFADTAEGSEIADYLSFLAAVSTAQAKAVEVGAPARMPDVSQAVAHAMPPLSRDLAREPGALSVLDMLLHELGAATLSEGPASIVAKLAGTDLEERRRMLIAVADGIYEVERLAESALIAAALQVWYAMHAAQLPMTAVRNIGETICPCCGSAPAASVVVGWLEAQNMRYLSCSLCQTMWNLVRVKCSSCGSTQGISYRTIEGTAGDIAAEVCETCNGYAKHLSHNKNPHLDPVADDVASFGLDIMLREAGWRRTGIDPFLILP